MARGEWLGFLRISRTEVILPAYRVSTRTHDDAGDSARNPGSWLRCDAAPSNASCNPRPTHCEGRGSRKLHAQSQQLRHAPSFNTTAQCAACCVHLKSCLLQSTS